MLKIQLLLFLMSASVFASCYKVGNMKGVSAYAKESYKIEDDGISGTIFTLRTSGKKASIVPGNMHCLALNELSIVCIDGSETKATVETWFVNKNKVQYTKTSSGVPMFDSARIFIGDVLENCTEDSSSEWENVEE